MLSDLLDFILVYTVGKSCAYVILLIYDATAKTLLILKALSMNYRKVHQCFSYIEKGIQFELCVTVRRKVNIALSDNLPKMLS